MGRCPSPIGGPRLREGRTVFFPRMRIPHVPMTTFVDASRFILPDRNFDFLARNRRMRIRGEASACSYCSTTALWVWIQIARHCRFLSLQLSLALFLQAAFYLVTVYVSMTRSWGFPLGGCYALLNSLTLEQILYIKKKRLYNTSILKYRTVYIYCVKLPSDSYLA